MTVQQECLEAIGTLQATYTSERAAAILEFARKRGLEKGTVTLPDGAIHSAAQYALYLYCNAHEIGQPETEEDNTSYQIVAMLIAMEAIRKDHWTYGSRLMFDLKREHIQVTRQEWAAFLAQEGTYKTNINKGYLLDGNMMAVSMYCAHLKTVYNSFPCAGKGLYSRDTGAVKDMLEARQPSAQATIETLALKYVPALIGEENKKRVLRFLNYLRKSDFYIAPASTKYHMARPLGLAEHTVNVIYRTAFQLLPATDAQIGEMFLAAFGHDVCKADTYEPDWKKKKVYREGGKLWDNGGQFDWDPYLGYNYNEELRFGHGRKSMHIVDGFFEEFLPESVGSAIDAHMHDIEQNPDVGLQMMEEPLGLWLHIADVLATHIDEYDIGPVETAEEFNQLVYPAPAQPQTPESEATTNG